MISNQYNCARGRTRHQLRSLSALVLLCWLAMGCMARQQPCCIEVPMMTSINIVDRNGLSETINNQERLTQYEQTDFLQPQPYQKVLRVYARDCQGNIPACITSYHPNGTIRQYLEVVNSRACGVYKEWHANGVLKLETTVIEGTADLVEGAERSWIFDGCAQAWREDGSLEATIPYLRGELEGLSIYYHPNGAIWKKIPYHKNKIDGLSEIYRADGCLLQRTAYCQGVKEGSLQRYWDEEQLASDELYCEGLLVYGRYFQCDGAEIAHIDNGNGWRAIFGKEGLNELQEYRYGRLDGEVKLFDKYGRVNKLYHVKNGCKHGEELFYYDAVRLQEVLVPKLSLNWYEGKIQGLVKTWYDDGRPESQKEMSNNKKNGHSTAWYRDGSLMMIEEYDQDILVRGEYYSRNERVPSSAVNDGNGLVTLFDADGNQLQKIAYRHGKPQLDDSN